MNTRRHSHRQGFSSLDLVVMMIAVGIVAMIGYTYVTNQRANSKAKRIQCVSNLKCLGLSVRLWASDNGDKNPAMVSVTNGGVMELATKGAVFPHFQVMSNELGTPKILICPADHGRKYATNFGSLTDANSSYFIGLDADETQLQGWLVGDRNLATNDVPLKPGLATISSNSLVSWTAQLHVNQGNVVLADGSAQQFSISTLRKSVPNALPVYSNTTTNWSFRVAIP